MTLVCNKGAVKAGGARLMAAAMVVVLNLSESYVLCIKASFCRNGYVLNIDNSRDF